MPARSEGRGMFLPWARGMWTDYLFASTPKIRYWRRHTTFPSHRNRACGIRLRWLCLWLLGSDIEQVLREKKSFTLRCMLDGIKELQGGGVKGNKFASSVSITSA